MTPLPEYQEDLQNVIDVMNHAQHLKLEVWKEHVLFSGHWWLGVMLTVVPWLLWIVYRNKESSNRLLFVGFFLMIVSTFLDFLGTKLGLWYYYYDVIPFIPAFIPWDITLIPISVMFLIEWKRQLHPVIKGLLFSGITAFVVEPFFVWISLYQPVQWKHFYSFPIFFLLYMLGDFLSKRKNFASVSDP